MEESLKIKAESIIKEFSSCSTPEDMYAKIIDFGKALPPMDLKECLPEQQVQGCQSLMYLKGSSIHGKMEYSVFSEALISKGLAALLLFYYNGETPEAILKNPPEFLQKLKITASLTPGRSNGLASLYKMIREIALKQYLEISSTMNKS